MLINLKYIERKQAIASCLGTGVSKQTISAKSFENTKIKTTLRQLA